MQVQYLYILPLQLSSLNIHLDNQSISQLTQSNNTNSKNAECPIPIEQKAKDRPHADSAKAPIEKTTKTK